MSRGKKLRNEPNLHVNCVTEEMEYLPKARKLAKENRKFEKSQRYEVIQVDGKTVRYRRLKEGERPKKGMKIHKGLIH